MTPISLAGTTPRNILLATDLTSRCDRAFDRAAQLARQWSASLHVLHAIEALPPAIPAGVDPDAYLRAHPDPTPVIVKTLERLVGETPARIHVETLPVPAAILAVAERENCDLIVLGESRDQLLGPLESTVEEVVRKASVSVLLVRTRPTRDYMRLVVGTDFTDEAKQALVRASGLFPTAAMQVVHAAWMPYTGLLNGTPSVGDKVMQQRGRLRALVDGSGIPAERSASIRIHAEAGAPARVLERCTEDMDADLLVIGAHTRGMVYDAVLGSSRAIIQGVTCDVLIVRAVRDAS